MDESQIICISFLYIFALQTSKGIFFSKSERLPKPRKMAKVVADTSKI